MFKGKYGYCAPEQLEGGRIDRRTDVFCLGIVLWECLTGARLFDVGTDVETIDAVRSRRIERPGVAAPRSPSRARGDRHCGRWRANRRNATRAPTRCREELDRFLLARNNRPTTTSVGQWIEALFGSERAALKKSISQGDSAEGALQRLKAIDAATAAPQAGKVVQRALAGATARALVDQLRRARPPIRRRARAGAGRRDGGHPPGERLDRRADRRIRAGPGGARAASPVPPAVRRRRALLLVGVAGRPGRDRGGWRSGRSRTRTRRARPTRPRRRPRASLDLQSQPRGASIFVDGRPTGLKTPAMLRACRRASSEASRRPGRLRGGHQETTLIAGQPQNLSFTLQPVRTPQPVPERSNP